ncbi:hypothetical protein [Kushneria aurantia]|uniref:Uncharacterized protein n=1 Tax=Kushneria aurantia TaxID=504092 RepID=A0ABV6G1M9_9GAMM|nr:hypothetical protein [Kushneria aurantia]
MINTITARVIGASRYEVEGTKGAKIIAMNPASPEADNAIGHQVMTIAAPYDMLEQLRQFAPDMPCNLEIDAEMRPSGGKMTFFATAVRRPKGSQAGTGTNTQGAAAQGADTSAKK